MSVGTVWRVGGLAPVSGVSDGRGGLIGSGTNAPLYTTSFSARPRTQEDTELHESRLAEALDLDRTARVLEFRDPETSPTRINTPVDARGRSSRPIPRTIWKGTEWLMGGPDRSMYHHFIIPSQTKNTSLVDFNSLSFVVPHPR